MEKLLIEKQEFEQSVWVCVIVPRERFTGVSDLSRGQPRPHTPDPAHAPQPHGAGAAVPLRHLSFPLLSTQRCGRPLPRGKILFVKTQLIR